MADNVTTKVLVQNGTDYIATFTNISDGTGESAVGHTSGDTYCIILKCKIA